MAKASTPKIRHVAWREGRPRFMPAKTLRDRGYKGKDLKHPDGSWYTAGQALDWSNELVRQLKDLDTEPMAQPVIAPVERRSVYPVSRLFEDWLASPRVTSKRPATIKDYRQKSRVFQNFDPDLWASEVIALDQMTCAGLYEELWQEIGLATARGAMTVLGMAIKWGMRTGRVQLKINPARDLDMQQPPPRARFLTREEFEALAEAAEAMKRPDVADVFYAGVWTGQRQGDRLGMRLSQFRTGRLIQKQSKTMAIVDVPVAPELKKRLDAAAERRRAADKVSPMAFLNEHTWEPWSHWTYRDLFSEARRRAAEKLPSVATVKEKDFRATAVTWMALARQPIPQICAVSGHSLQSAYTILKHYLALHPDMATSAINAMVEWYEAGANTDLAV